MATATQQDAAIDDQTPLGSLRYTRAALRRV